MRSPSPRKLSWRYLHVLLMVTMPSALTAFVPSRPRYGAIVPAQSVSFTRRQLYIDPDEHSLAREIEKKTEPSQASVTASPPAPTTTAATTTVRSSRRRKTETKKDYLHPINSPEEFDSVVRGESDRLVVVRFHAPYCKACQSIAVAYDRLAKSNPSVKFVDVTIKDKLDYPDLDVPATPYGHIWHPTAGLVEATPIARRQFSKFKKVLRSYVKGLCDMPDEFFTNPHYEFDNENLIL